MKILVISPYASPETGACAERVSYLKKFFGSRRHDVMVLAPARNNAFAGNVSRYSGLVGFFSFLLTLDYDIVLAEVPPVRDAFFASIVSRLRGKSFFVDERDLFVNSMTDIRAVPRDSLRFRANFFFERHAYHAAEKVFSVTNRDVSGLQNIFGLDGEKIVLARNGSDTSVIGFNAAERKKARKKLGVPDSAKIILHLGSIGDYDFSGFLEGMGKKFPARNFRMLFIVSDDGSAQNRLQLESLHKKLASPGLAGRSTVLANIPYERLNPYLCAADIGVVLLPKSHLNKVPVRVYDYLACGLDVVAIGAEKSELAELFQTDFEGFFSADWKGFFAALESALSKKFSSQRRKSISRAIRKGYSREKSAKIIYDSILGVGSEP